MFEKYHEDRTNVNVKVTKNMKITFSSLTLERDVVETCGWLQVVHYDIIYDVFCTMVNFEPINTKLVQWINGISYLRN